MTARRTLRVLALDPRLGKPGDTRDGSFPDAQGFVDLGYAEWVVERSEEIETAQARPAPEVATRRPTKRTTGKSSSRPDRPDVETR